MLARTAMLCACSVPTVFGSHRILYRLIPIPALIGDHMHRFRRLLSTRPWFVDPEPIVRRLPPHLAPKSHDLPPDLPAPVKELFHTLTRSPFLEPSTLEVTQPSPALPGPPLPKTIPKGRRGRGRTYSGEGITDDQGGIWNWFLIAQVRLSSISFTCIDLSKVKYGTENRGSIEAVVRLVRKTASLSWFARHLRVSFVLATENESACTPSPECQATGLSWLGYD